MYAPRAAASLLREKTKFIPSLFSFSLFFMFLFSWATLGGETHKISSSSIHNDSYMKFVYESITMIICSAGGGVRFMILPYSLHSLLSRAINRNVRINIIFLMAVTKNSADNEWGEKASHATDLQSKKNDITDSKTKCCDAKLLLRKKLFEKFPSLVSKMSVPFFLRRFFSKKCFKLIVQLVQL